MFRGTGKLRHVNIVCVCETEFISVSIMFNTMTLIWRVLIFWDIMPCGPLKANRRFGGKFHFHLQGKRISKAKNSREAGRCFPKMSIDFQLTALRTSNLTLFYLVDVHQRLGGTYSFHLQSPSVSQTRIYLSLLCSFICFVLIACLV
jgi:hypothetical protein